MNMIEQKSWDEFRDSGLLWFVNQNLHLFGWALAYEPETKKVFPARCKFRGFSERINTEGYQKVTKYLNESMSELLEDTKR